MTKRTDIHRPSALVPSEYEFVACDYIRIDSLADALFLQTERENIRKHMAHTGGSYSRHEHGGNCMVCGSVNAVYTIIFYHAPTNVYVRMGSDCAAQVEMGGWQRSFERMRKAVTDARERLAGKQKAEVMLADLDLRAAYDLYAVGYVEGESNDRYTVRDVVASIVRYGNVSDKQAAFLRRLLDRVAGEAQREAQRAAERAAAQPAPEGRVTVEGTIVSLKSQPGYMPGSYRFVMTVKTDAGWLAWGSQPDSIANAAKGDRVRFVATLERSDKDASFAFFKRPAKAEVLATAAHNEHEVAA